MHVLFSQTVETGRDWRYMIYDSEQKSFDKVLDLCLLHVFLYGANKDLRVYRLLGLYLLVNDAVNKLAQRIRGHFIPYKIVR